MLVRSNISHGRPVGTPQGRLSRLYSIEAKYLSDLDQSQPVTVLHGKDILSGTLLSCMENIKKVSGGSGKDKSISTTRYAAGLAMAFCCGKARLLYSVYNSEVKIYDAYVQNNEPVALGEDALTGTPVDIIIPEYSNASHKVRIYSGSQEQTQDSVFQDGIIVNNEFVIEAAEIPDYKGICYLASDFIVIGASPQMPNFRLEVFSCPAPSDFGWDDPVDNGDDSYPFKGVIPRSWISSDMDVNPAVIILDYLTNKNWGVCRLDMALINEQSFLTAIEQLYSENIYITSTLDSASNVRDAISDILEYIDGVLYLDTDGKIALKLIRKPADINALPTLDANWLTDEPEIDFGSTNDTWGTTKISFNDRSNAYEETTEIFESPYFKGQELGDRVVKEFNMPFIKTRDLAARTAKRLGSAGSMPSFECSVKVLPSCPINEVGDLFALTFNAYGVEKIVFRVSSITRSNSFDASVEISGVSVPLLDWNINSSVWQSLHTGSMQNAGIIGGDSYFAPRALKFTESGYTYFIEESPKPGLIERVLVNANQSQEYFNAEYGIKCDVVSWTVLNSNDRFSFTLRTTNRGIINAINAGNVKYLVCCAFENGNPTVKPMLFPVHDMNISAVRTDGDYYVFDIENMLCVVEYDGQEIGVTPDSLNGVLPGNVCYVVRALPYKTYAQVVWNKSVAIQVCAVDYNGKSENGGFSDDHDDPAAGYFLYDFATGDIQTWTKLYDGSLYDWTNNNIPWGIPISPASGSVVTAASEPSDTSALWINSVTGEYSVYSNGEWTPTGDIIDLPTMQNYSGQTISETVTNSMTINLTPERNTFIHIKITDSPITVTLSDAANSALGDRVTVICTSNNNATRWTATLAGVTNNFAKGDETYLSSFNVATGTMTELLCIGLGGSQKWMIASLSIIKQN